MGNREDLIAGAKICLREKGYARTTARDITAAAGTSLASIGYHFGSTEALMNAALFEAVDDWAGEFQRVLTVELDGIAGPVARFEAFWARVIESFTAHRELWAAWFEVFGQLERVPALRQAIADGTEQARALWVSMIQELDPAADAERTRALGSLHHAILGGVMVQWLVDPDRAPSARELTEALLTAAGVRD